MMKFNVLILFFFFSLFTLTSSSESDVNCALIPPSLWCSSQEISTKCGTKNLCENYKNASKDKKLKVSIVHRVSCPYCCDYMAKKLLTVYEPFADYIELELIPETPVFENGTLYCYGDGEICGIHGTELCADKHLSQPAAPVLVNCIYKNLDHKKWKESIQKCYNDLKVPIEEQKKIKQCVDGEEGKKLLVEASNKIENLYPASPKVVPSFVFNNYNPPNINLQGINQEYLPGFICQALIDVGNYPKFCD